MRTYCIAQGILLQCSLVNYMGRKSKKEEIYVYIYIYIYRERERERERADSVKKAECQTIDAFELWCWRRLLTVTWTAKKSNQSTLKKSVLNIHWKD